MALILVLCGREIMASVQVNIMQCTYDVNVNVNVNLFPKFCPLGTNLFGKRQFLRDGPWSVSVVGVEYLVYFHGCM